MGLAEDLVVGIGHRGSCKQMRSCCIFKLCLLQFSIINLLNGLRVLCLVGLDLLVLVTGVILFLIGLWMPENSRNWSNYHNHLDHCLPSSTEHPPVTHRRQTTPHLLPHLFNFEYRD
ncbi:hypothetical protein Hanom_Chr17g01537671 [Helianthus anomalus]